MLETDRVRVVLMTNGRIMCVLSNETNEIVPPHCARDDGRRIVCDSAQSGVYNYIINDDFAGEKDFTSAFYSSICSGCTVRPCSRSSLVRSCSLKRVWMMKKLDNARPVLES